jgi:hypothetical protein
VSVSDVGRAVRPEEFTDSSIERWKDCPSEPSASRFGPGAAALPRLPSRIVDRALEGLSERSECEPFRARRRSLATVAQSYRRSSAGRIVRAKRVRAVSSEATRRASETGKAPLGGAAPLNLVALRMGDPILWAMYEPVIGG